MIDLGQASFYIDVPSLAGEEFESYSTRLFDQWDGHLAEALALPDYSLSLVVDEGSIKGKGRIATLATVLYFGIGQYGSFVSGIETIWSQVSAAGTFLGKAAAAPFGAEKVKPKITKQGGDLGKLRKLFDQVQSGRLSVDQAMQQAERMLGNRVDVDFLNGLDASLRSAPSYHQQTPIFPPHEFSDPLLSVSEGLRPSPSRQPSRRQPSLALRVEVWRESKGSRRNVRMQQI